MRLWTTVPTAVAGSEDDGSPFVCPALLPAMLLGEDLEIDAPVSPLLLRGLAEVGDLYRAWAPELRGGRLRAAAEAEREIGGRGVGCFFSRGVDSTLQRSCAARGSGPAH